MLGWSGGPIQILSRHYGRNLPAGTHIGSFSCAGYTKFCEWLTVACPENISGSNRMERLIAAEGLTVFQLAFYFGDYTTAEEFARHRVYPTTNTFIEHARLNKIGTPVTTAMAQLHLGADTATVWCKYCRNVAMKIAWHYLGQIGEAGDVVEIDKTHLFKIQRGKVYHVAAPLVIWRYQPSHEKTFLRHGRRQKR
ncbi:hypothetical protein FQA39_LY09079 [Lamprigera yunnana]|nr:hypothetical protein FQA39_LY09079 [Lamprigera yunnana]